MAFVDLTGKWYHKHKYSHAHLTEEASRSQGRKLITATEAVSGAGRNEAQLLPQNDFSTANRKAYVWDFSHYGLLKAISNMTILQNGTAQSKLNDSSETYCKVSPQNWCFKKYTILGLFCFQFVVLLGLEVL